MKAVHKQPLLARFHWALLAMIGTYALYGIVGWVGQRILTAQRTGGSISPSLYISAQAQFMLILGIVVTAILLACYVFCVAGAKGSRRVAFLLGLPSSFGPILAATASTLLFSVLHLPTMGAGSVLAAAASAIVLMFPAIIMFLMMAFNRKNTKGSRWLLALAALLSLIAALFPVVVTVLSLLVMAGNPAVAPYMTASAFVIHLRPIVLALGLCAAYFPNRKHHSA